MSKHGEALNPLTGPREKLGRAHKHFLEIERQIQDFWHAHRHEIVVTELNAEGTHYALRARVPCAPPLEWGAIIGEIAHDLRSALDGLVWQLIILNGIDPSTLSRPLPAFPIFLRGQSATGPSYAIHGKPLVHRRIRPEHEAIIKRLQPYHRRNGGRQSTLWLLHELNNSDKHRLIQVVAAATAEQWSNFMFGYEARNVSHQEIRVATQYTGRILVDGAKVGRVERGVIDAEEVEVKFLPITEIAFSKGCDALYGMPIMRVLGNMGLHLRNILFGDFREAFGPFPPEWDTNPDSA